MSQTLPDAARRQTLAFGLAGVTFGLWSVAQGVEPLSLPPIYSAFLPGADDAPLAGSYEICGASSVLDPPLLDRLIWNSLPWRMGLAGNDTLSIEIHNVQSDRWFTVANLARDFSSGRVRPVSRIPGRMSPYSLNYPYDQAVLINRLLHLDTAVLHSSGIDWNGTGMLFCGPSGVGKTTIGRLWRDRGATLLNDEKVAVQVGDDVCRLAGTPWHGEEKETHPGIVPLRGIFLLEQAPQNRLRRLDAPEAVARLIATAVAPFYSAEGMAMALDIWDRVIERVPAFALEFTPDNRALDLCASAVSRQNAC